MENTYYVLSITITSSGGEQRVLTPYNDIDVAKRKYHEAFAGIGAGPKFISAEVLDRYLNVVPGFKDWWEKEEPQPEPEA